MAVEYVMGLWQVMAGLPALTGESPESSMKEVTLWILKKEQAIRAHWWGRKVGEEERTLRKRKPRMQKPTACLEITRHSEAPEEGVWSVSSGRCDTQWDSEPERGTPALKSRKLTGALDPQHLISEIFLNSKTPRIKLTPYGVLLKIGKNMKSACHTKDPQYVDVLVIVTNSKLGSDYDMLMSFWSHRQ